MFFYLMEQFHIIPVHVITLVEDQKNPTLFLYCQGENKIIPVLIGLPEARILALSLGKAILDRPLTHNLLLNTIKAMGGELTRVVIFDVIDQTFYAKVCIKVGNEEVQVDARPSDALILAVQSVRPIFVTDQVIKKAAQQSPVDRTAAQSEHALTPEEIEALKKHLHEAQEREEKEG